MTKSGFAFQPAPRPKPRVSTEEAQALQEATKDLGFGRPTAPPADVQPTTPATSPERPATATATSSRQAQSDPVKRGPALKFDVPEEVWDSLRMEAVRRRVTVKYLVLEALAAKGYEVDLAAVPEDGRRIR